MVVDVLICDEFTVMYYCHGKCVVYLETFRYLSAVCISLSSRIIAALFSQSEVAHVFMLSIAPLSIK